MVGAICSCGMVVYVPSAVVDGKGEIATCKECGAMWQTQTDPWSPSGRTVRVGEGRPPSAVVAVPRRPLVFILGAVQGMLDAMDKKGITSTEVDGLRQAQEEIMRFVILLEMQ